MKIENHFTPLEIRFAESDPKEMSFSGYGARFNNVDSHGDVIVPGAFKSALDKAEKSGNWPAMLLQHGSFMRGDDNMPVGVWTTMREDSKGLFVEGKLADTTRGRDTYQLLKMEPRPAINGLSIGFRAIDWSITNAPRKGGEKRTLKSLDLLEISLVTTPSNDLARVGSVKAAGDINTIREFEEFLRDVAGYSHAAAKSIAAGGFKPTDPRDEDAGDAIVARIRRNIETFKTKR